MTFRESFTSGLCILVTITTAQAFIMPNLIRGYNEDPCGTSLETLRRMGYGYLIAPRQNPNATGGAANRQLSFWEFNRILEHDTPDLPDLPVNMLPPGTGLPGHPNAVRTNPLGGAVGGAAIPAHFPRECRCGFQCRMNGWMPDQKHAADCAQPLSCCCRAIF